MKNLLQKARHLFEEKFNKSAEFVVRAPGRVNLIGEHTDYNDGFVLPIALNKGICIAVSENKRRTVNIVAGNFSPTIQKVDLELLKKSDDGWLEYLKGIINELELHYQCKLKGFDAAIVGDLPIGAGLSSSAALELAFAKAFTYINQIEWQPKVAAQLAQRAENNWVGVNCGIMDQLISAMGKTGHALLIDCRSLECKPLPLPKDATVIVMDTATRRELVASAYNEHRQQCELAAKTLQVKALRDASLSDLDQLRADLDEQVYARAKHVITECDRTLVAQETMLSGDVKILGELFKQSHQSLADDFNVTNTALDSIVALANDHAACYGARMTGAGFGGCAIALIQSSQVDSFCKQIAADYFAAMQLEANIFPVTAQDGVAIVA